MHLDLQSNIYNIVIYEYVISIDIKKKKNEVRIKTTVVLQFMFEFLIMYLDFKNVYFNIVKYCKTNCVATVALYI